MPLARRTSPPSSRASAVREATAKSADAVDARTILDALRAVTRELRLVERSGQQQLGLQPAQLHALRELAARSAVSLVELAARTHTDPSSASVVVQRLVARGLVARAASDTDRRRTELRATPAGRALAARAPAAAVARVTDALAMLGDRQTAALSRGLRALADGLRPTESRSGAER